MRIASWAGAAFLAATLTLGAASAGSAAEPGQATEVGAAGAQTQTQDAGSASGAVNGAAQDAASSVAAVEVVASEADSADGAAGAGPAGEHPVYHLRPEPFSDAAAQRVSLEELLQLAVDNNLGVNLQNYTIEKSHYSLDQTYYAFDPSASSSLGYTERKGTSAGSVPGTFYTGKNSSYSAAASYSIPLEYGDAFRLNYDLGRSDFSSESASGHRYSASAGLSYTRPLARGAGRHVNLIPRCLASLSLDLSYDRLDDDVRKLKKNVMDAYFQAVAARQAIDLRQTSLDLALKQLERAVERYKVGLGIQAEVLQAENSVLTQRSQLLSAESAYAGILDTLTTLVGLPQEYEIAVDADGALIDMGEKMPEDLWALVQSNSYDLKALNSQLASLRLTRDQQLDRLRPQADLALSYGRSGSDDTLVHAASGMSTENWGATLTWQSTPGERTAQAQVAQTDIDLASLDLSIQDGELQLKAQLRSLQRDLQTKYMQIGLAQSNLDVLKQTYDIQVERNAVGLATTLDVVEAEERLLFGELALLQARVDYQQAYRGILLLAGLI